jgi:Icc-related predicted phosphoesterase
MKIIALTDLHGKTGIFRLISSQLKTADLVVLCGDITHFGRKKEISGIIGQLGDINPALFAVSGNCDYPEVEEYLVHEGMSLNATFREFMGYYFVGLSGSLPCPGKTPNEYSEEEYGIITENLHVPSDKPLIMVSHQPPSDTLNDEVTPGYHVGSRAIRRFIDRHQPLICFTGHIHEGVGIDHIGKTAVINPGPSGSGGYALAEVHGQSMALLEVIAVQ